MGGARIQDSRARPSPAASRSSATKNRGAPTRCRCSRFCGTCATPCASIEGEAMSPVRVHRAPLPLSRFGAWTLSRAQRCLRLATYLGLAFALVSALAVRSVQGSVGEAAFALGRQLAAFEDVTRSSYRVRLNGES